MKKNYSVYIIGAFKGKSHIAVKIGVASDVGKRLAELQVGNHCRLDLIAEYPAKSMAHAYAIENEAHRTFRRNHIRGEWFSGRKAIGKYFRFFRDKNMGYIPIIDE